MNLRMKILTPSSSKINKNSKKINFYLTHGYRIIKNQLIDAHILNSTTGGKFKNTKNKQICDGKLTYINEEIKECNNEVPFTRNYLNSLPQLKYRQDNLLKLTLHHGQRKLLLSEIEFLTEYGHLSNNIVYAGSAPGIHTKFLSILFPNHHFYLYDPAPFVVKESSKISLNNEYFTNEVCKKLNKKFKGDLLFISDIRRTPEIDDMNLFENMVYEDLMMQKDWIKLMKPKMSMLKFRIPFNKKEIEYFDGIIKFQVWAPISSSETRLITDGSKMTKYSAEIYENIMYRFNICTRQQIFTYIPKLNISGFDRCYDCTAEYNILSNYIKKYKNNWDISKFINNVTKHCKQPLKKMCHGFDTINTKWYSRLEEVNKIIN